MRALLRLEEDLGYLAKDVSEVNAADPDNIRIVAQVENRAVELMLGDGNFATALSEFSRALSGDRKRSPEVKIFDLRLDDRITARGVDGPNGSETDLRSGARRGQRARRGW